MTDNLTLLVAEIYMRGGSFAVTDDANVLVLEPEPGMSDDLLPALQRQGNELRDLILDGIHQHLDGYQPALDGLESPRRLEQA